MGAHQALVEALLATLVNSADATDLVCQWARLESHFDTIFTTDVSIESGGASHTVGAAGVVSEKGLGKVDVNDAGIVVNNGTWGVK